MLDGCSAKLSGSDKFGTFDTDPRAPKLPANINYDELHSGLFSPPVETNRAMDMVFCALWFDLRSYWTTNTIKQRQKGLDDCLWDSYGSSADMRERDKAIDEVEQILETKYIRYCDPSQPIQLIATLVARGAVGTMRLIAHHPRRWGSEDQIPEFEREYVRNLSIKLLKKGDMMCPSHELNRFSWHAAFCFQWQAFITILDTLRVNSLVQEAVKGWQLIEEPYETYPDFVTNTKKSLYVPVGNLCLKAYNARGAALAKEGKRYHQRLHISTDFADSVKQQIHAE